MFNVKSVLFFVALAGAIFVVNCDKYSEKYDDFDVDAMLSNPCQRDQFYKCLAGEKACPTQEAKFLKDRLREAMVLNCQKCTEKQKIAFDKISKFYSKNEPVKYRNIMAKLIDRERSH